MKESQIEAAFCEYLEQQKGYHVLGRQVPLPLGRLDVLAYWSSDDYACPVIAEIKTGVADEHACTQLLGYVEQVHYLMRSRLFVLPDTEYEEERCRAILVGTVMSEFVQRVILSLGMIFVEYQLQGQEIEFLRHEGHGDCLDEFVVDGPLDELMIQLDTAKANHLIGNALRFRSYANYQHILGTAPNARSKCDLIPTVAYWKRS